MKSFDLADVYRHLLSENQLSGYEVTERFYEIGSAKFWRNLMPSLRHQQPAPTGYELRSINIMPSHVLASSPHEMASVSTLGKSSEAEESMSSTDFLVIGGGIIGLSVARELKHRFLTLT
jgi:hypothetical protein